MCAIAFRFLASPCRTPVSPGYNVSFEKRERGKKEKRKTPVEFEFSLVRLTPKAGGSGIIVNS